MASVIGLAPIRPDLKGRLRELLCIHGQKWSPRLVSRQRLLVFSEALICLSYSGEKTIHRFGKSAINRGVKAQSGIGSRVWLQNQSPKRQILAVIVLGDK